MSEEVSPLKSEKAVFKPMGDSEQIWVTFVNNAAGDLAYLGANLMHGKFGDFDPTSPVTPIYGTNDSRHSSSGQLAFVASGVGGGGFGTTGTVTYTLPDNGGLLVIMFNVPYSGKGSGDYNNPYVYALIQPATNETNVTSFYATIDGFDMVPDPPAETYVMQITITINPS